MAVINYKKQPGASMICVNIASLTKQLICGFLFLTMLYLLILLTVLNHIWITTEKKRDILYNFQSVIMGTGSWSEISSTV